MKKNALNEETTKLCQETNLFDEIFDLYMIVREHFLVLGVNIEKYFVVHSLFVRNRRVVI